MGLKCGPRPASSPSRLLPKGRGHSGADSRQGSRVTAPFSLPRLRSIPRTIPYLTLKKTKKTKMLSWSWVWSTSKTTNKSQSRSTTKQNKAVSCERGPELLNIKATLEEVPKFLLRSLGNTPGRAYVFHSTTDFSTFHWAGLN